MELKRKKIFSQKQLIPQMSVKLMKIRSYNENV